MINILKVVLTISSICSTVSPFCIAADSSAEVKGKSRVICIEYADFITNEKYSVCGAHAYDYLSDVNTIKHLPKASKSQEIVNSLTFLNTPSFSVSYNGISYFDVSYPANYSASLIGVYTPIETKLDYITIKEDSIDKYDSLVFGDAYPTFYSSSLETRVREKIKDIRIAIPEADIKLGDYYTSQTKTITRFQKFYSNPIDGYDYPPWRIERFSYYMPIQIRQFKSCSTQGSGCKGTKGSYVSDVFYHFVPVNDVSLVECYDYHGIKISPNYSGHDSPRSLSDIATATGHPHIRLSNIHDI